MKIYLLLLALGLQLACVMPFRRARAAPPPPAGPLPARIPDVITTSDHRAKTKTGNMPVSSSSLDSSPGRSSPRRKRFDPQHHIPEPPARQMALSQQLYRAPAAASSYRPRPARCAGHTCQPRQCAENRSQGG
ncbi:MAG: hypothetical protein FJW38_09700 [Acidobacteria bacterium]|nr:hypothetical protein [Acidobacteriota bacterium]